MRLRVLVGLGNPGVEYAQTRHNAGLWWMEEIARRYAVCLRPHGKFRCETAQVRIGTDALWLLRPLTYMNRSGQPVGEFLRYHDWPSDAALVAHDDLDLAPGIARFKRGGGHGGHNGLRDLVAHLGDADFFRLRIGIGHPGHRDQVTPYVLGRPAGTDAKAIETAIRNAADALPTLIERGWDAATHVLHSE